MAKIKLLPQWTRTTEDRVAILRKLIKAVCWSPFIQVKIYKTDFLTDDKYAYNVLTRELYVSTNICKCLTEDFETFKGAFPRFGEIF